MSDHQSIAELYHRYVNCIDNGDFKQVAELFRQCSVSDGDGNILASGYDQVLAMYTGLVRIYPDTGTPKTQHLVSNLIVGAESGEGILEASANFTVMQKLESGSVEAIICGKYNNQFVKVDRDWTFQRHSMTPRIIGDMSRHLLIEVGEIQAQ